MSSIKFFDSLSLTPKMVADLLNHIVLLQNRGEPVVFQKVIQVLLESECELRYQQAIDQYTESLKAQFKSREAAISQSELFEIFS